jgi:hypothetical protein
MVFPILGSGLLASGYDIDNSIRFNDPDNPTLKLAIGSDGDRRACTISMWVKKSHPTERQILFYQGDDNGNSEYVGLEFSSEDRLNFFAYQGEATVMLQRSSALFRDPSAWYHIVANIDTDQGTAADRANIYVNGTQITDFSTTAIYPNQNTDLNIGNNADDYIIGGVGLNFEKSVDGYLADVAFVDGTQYAASEFGEFDEDSGIWKPKEPDVTWGAKGFFMEFKQSGTGTDASGLGADTSGNDNHLAPANLAATDQCTDTPTNNFATLRIAQAPQASPVVLTEGNCDFDYTHDGSDTRDGQQHCVSTIAMSSGKWYCECKLLESVTAVVGIENLSRRTFDDVIENWYGIYGANGRKAVQDYTGQSVVYSTYGSAFSTDDIVMVALDMDNKNIYWGKDGSWGDGSGNFDEASPHTAHAITSNFLTVDGDGSNVVFNFMSLSSGASPRFQVNFGNPVHSISSGNADANGYGNFEYAVPSGYYALCTKNLAEYG